MLFISRDRSPEFVLSQGGQTLTSTPTGPFVQTIKPATVQFERLAQPFKTSALPLKGDNRQAEGMLDSSVAAEKLRREGHGRFEGEGEERRDVTEDWVIRFLMGLREYGRDFVAVDDDGTEILDTIVVPEGSGGFFCTVCNKHLKNAQAKEGHVRASTEHAERVKAAQGQAFAALG